MTTVMERQNASAMRQVVALSLPITLAQLDPNGLSDLLCYVKCLSEAMQRNDADGVAEAQQAIREVFELPDTTEGVEVGETLEEMKSSPDGAAAVAEMEAENTSFMSRYIEAKSEKGLGSQRAVADACDMSVNTVNAIETQRTAPQFRTMEKLAKGLGVTTNWLMTGNGPKR